MSNIQKPNDAPDIVNDYSASYTFDDYGNIKTKIQGSQTSTYTYDKNNRVLTETLVQSTGTIITKYTYDPNGNTLSERKEIYANASTGTESAGLKTGTNYLKLSHYNHYNQLVKISTEKGTYKYTYNAQGLRFSKSGPAGVDTFSWDGSELVAEYKNGYLKWTYLNGVGAPIHLKDAGTGKTHYYFHNAHGDVTALTDGSGNISTLYDYNAYGEVNVRGENIYNPLRYFGQYYDEETGSYYLRARYYDPSLMRFTSEDTYKGNFIEPLSLNLYLYCWGNPVYYHDETGNGNSSDKLKIDGAGSNTNPAKTSTETGGGGKTSSGTSGAGGLLAPAVPKLGEVMQEVGSEVNMMLNAAVGDPKAVLVDLVTGGINKAAAGILENAGKNAVAYIKGAGKVNWKSVKQFGHTFTTHGSGAKNTKSLIDRARSTGNNQGQWLDNQKAAEFLDSLGDIKEPTTISIPEGLGQVITPNGEIIPATKVIVVPSKTGIKTAYPVP